MHVMCELGSGVCSTWNDNLLEMYSSQFFGNSGKCRKLGGNVFHVKRFAWWPVT